MDPSAPSGGAPQPNPFTFQSPTSPTAQSQMSTHQLEIVVDALARVATQTSEQTRAMQSTLDLLSRRNTSESGLWARLLSKPEIFKPKDRDEGLSLFPEWQWQLKQYVRAISPPMFELMEGIESDLDTECEHFSMLDEAVEQSRQLYSLLASLLRERPVQILRAIPDGNGCEVWRNLVRTLAPSSKARSLALLGAISQFPQMTNSNYHEQILKLEELCRKYEQSASKPVDSELKAAILLRALPPSLRTHVSINCPENASYDVLREVILRYERATQKWTTQVVTGFTSLDTSAPMEVDLVQKGKAGKSKGDKGGKGSKGGEGQGSWYKPSGHWYNSKGYGKDKGGNKGKDGKDKGGGKKGGKSQNDKGKGKGKPVPADTCKICGKKGHWSRECWMNKPNNRVNQVNDSFPPSSSTSSTTLTPNAQYRTDNSANIKRVFNLAADVDAPLCTVHELGSESEVEDSVTDWWCRKVDAEVYELDDGEEVDVEGYWSGPECFDLSMDDALPGDDGWVKDYVRMVDNSELETGPPCGGQCWELVLDSGADVSVMPAECLEHAVGTEDVSSGYVSMRDAQGRDMPHLGSRMVTLDFGPACVQESFHASSVSTPLLSLGRLLKQGWSLQQCNSLLCLCCEDVAIPVSFRRNSLVVEASIYAVQEPPLPSPSAGPESIRPLTEGKRIFAKLNFDPDELASRGGGHRDALGRGWHFEAGGIHFVFILGFILQTLLL